MKAPQIIFIILSIMDLLVTARKHGEPKGNYNIVVKIIDYAILTGILLWGGFLPTNYLSEFIYV